jgi:glycosyltransferase involved in cell wall biosynthesis
LKPIVAIAIATRDNWQCLWRCLFYLETIKPQPKYWLFCENNSTDQTMEVIKAWKQSHPRTYLIRLWFRDDYKGDTRYDKIAIVREYLLKKARQLHPDYLIFIDDDIWVQTGSNLIGALTYSQVDIIGAPYLRYFATGEEGLWIASKWFNPDRKDGFIYRKAADPYLQQVAMTSGGCLCLSKNVLKDNRLHFYPVPEDCSEDFGFCKTARDLGYKIWLEGRIQLKHVMYKGNKSTRDWYVTDEEAKQIEVEWKKKHGIKNEETI